MPTPPEQPSHREAAAFLADLSESIKAEGTAQEFIEQHRDQIDAIRPTHEELFDLFEGTPELSGEGVLDDLEAFAHHYGHEVAESLRRQQFDRAAEYQTLAADLQHRITMRLIYE